jgi:spore coat protein U-like protein
MPATSRARLLLAAGLALPLLAADAVEAQQANLTVKAKVVGECTLTGGTLDFGTYMSGQDSTRDRQTTIGLDCPPGLSVTVMMSGGNNQGADSFRNMAGSGDLLKYQLYTDSARTQVWSSGTTGGKRINGTAGGNEAHTVFGHVPSNQVVDPGNYADTVLITLAVHS